MTTARIFYVLIALNLMSCASSSSTSKPQIYFDGMSKPVSFQIEVAQTSAQLEQGLMFRKSMPSNSGMLFIFPDEQIRAFWMKNTLIPLDMIFMDSKKQIIGIVYNATPESLDLRTVTRPAQYVLEVNAGEAKKHGLDAGVQARW